MTEDFGPVWVESLFPGSLVTVCLDVAVAHCLILSKHPNTVQYLNKSINVYVIEYFVTFTDERVHPSVKRVEFIRDQSFTKKGFLHAP